MRLIPRRGRSSTTGHERWKRNYPGHFLRGRGGRKDSGSGCGSRLCLADSALRAAVGRNALVDGHLAGYFLSDQLLATACLAALWRHDVPFIEGRAGIVAAASTARQTLFAALSAIAAACLFGAAAGKQGTELLALHHPDGLLDLYHLTDHFAGLRIAAFAGMRLDTTGPGRRATATRGFRHVCQQQACRHERQDESHTGFSF